MLPGVPLEISSHESGRCQQVLLNDINVVMPPSTEHTHGYSPTGYVMRPVGNGAGVASAPHILPVGA